MPARERGFETYVTLLLDFDSIDFKVCVRRAHKHRRSCFRGAVHVQQRDVRRSRHHCVSSRVVALRAVLPSLPRHAPRLSAHRQRRQILDHLLCRSLLVALLLLQR